MSVSQYLSILFLHCPIKIRITNSTCTAAVQEQGGDCPPEATAAGGPPGRLAEHSYSIPGCLTPPDDSPAVSTPGHVTPYVSPPSSPPTLTPQRPLSPRTPELPSCPDTPKYKTNMLYRYLQDAAEAHQTFAEDSR